MRVLPSVLFGCVALVLSGCGGDDGGVTATADGGDDAVTAFDGADSGVAADAHDAGGTDARADGGSDTATLSDAVVPTDTATTDTGDGGKTVRPGACAPTLPTPTPDLQTARPKGTTCAKLGYYEYVPPAYSTSSNWPLIIAFHGDGERGDGSATELAKLLDNGLSRDIPRNTWDPKKRFVVLMPQMDDRGGLPERGAASVDAFVKFAKANYDVDVKRIYLTGLSGGGAPVYNYLGTYAGGEVAATNINAGWYSTQGKECTWKDVPIWYFHSDKDTVVPPPEHSTKSYDTLVACSPGAKVAPRYTMFAGLGHGAWGPAYDLTGMDATKYPLVTTPPGTTPYDVSLYDWFLKYSR